MKMGLSVEKGPAIGRVQESCLVGEGLGNVFLTKPQDAGKMKLRIFCRLLWLELKVHHWGEKESVVYKVEGKF